MNNLRENNREIGSGFEDPVSISPRFRTSPSMTRSTDMEESVSSEQYRLEKVYGKAVTKEQAMASLATIKMRATVSGKAMEAIQV